MKLKYAIADHEKIIGLYWETEKLGNVLVIYPNTQIDFNMDLAILDCETNEAINYVDLKEFLLNALPINNKQ